MGNNNGLVLLLLGIGALYMIGRGGAGAPPPSVTQMYYPSGQPAAIQLTPPTGGIPLTTYIPTSNISNVWRRDTAEPVRLDIAKQKLFRKTANGKRPLVVGKYSLL